MFRSLSILISIFTLFACSTITTEHVPTPTKANRAFYLFLDGTANDANSRTNVAKLHGLVTLKNDPNIATLYIDGVGTERTGKILGLGVGLGNAKRVKLAYRFLAENYKDGDKLYVFGFSRGAWSSRILASMLYVAGLPDFMHLKESERKDVVDDIYNKYKKFWSTLSEDNRTLAERRDAVIGYLEEKNLTANHIEEVDVDFLGLWDTVQALGIQGNYDNDVGEPNPRYADQLCNIKQVAHAVSIDDNRFDEFTPLLFKQKHFIQQACLKHRGKNDRPLETKINEVWFAGTHSDVGGGYDDTSINGVSLNWMLSEMGKAGIIEQGVKVYGNYLDKTHNPNTGFLGWLYNDKSRALNEILDSNNYVDPSHKDANKKAKIKLHPSVLDRLCVRTPETFESRWFQQKPFKGCVVCDGSNGRLADKKHCSDNLELENEDTNYTQDTYLTSLNLCKPTDCELSKEGDSLTRNDNPIKSCNLSLPATQNQAHQRLNSIMLDKDNHMRTQLTYFTDRKNDHTGVILKQGLTYKLTIENTPDVNSTLQDCSYQSGLSGRGIWDTSNNENHWYSNFFLKLGTVIMWPTVEYMFEKLTAVVGKIDQHTIVFHDILKMEQVNKDSGAKLTGTFSVPQTGELILTVNEPFWNDFAEGEFF